MKQGFVFALVAALGLVAVAAPAAVHPDGSVGYLSGPADGAPIDIALGYLNSNPAELGLVAGDLNGVVVPDQYRTKHNGLTHIYLRQTVDGVEVINANLSINVASDGRIVNYGGRFFGDLNGAVNARAPQLAPEDAIVVAARHVGLPTETEISLVTSEAGRDMGSLYLSPTLSIEEIPVRLRYFGLDSGELRLVWETRLRLPSGDHWWTVWVDAQSGEALEEVDWVSHDSYNVFAYPKESPLDGPQTLEVDPAHPIGSPFGWHDTDGVPGAEFTDTRGNNVEAQEDLDANNIPGNRPNGGPNLVFDFDFDPGLSPEDNLLQATTNLFYWNNVTHDLMYLYGFDEPSGNFQVNNFGLGGNGGDPVQADAQDGSGTNNANFSTPPDGGDGRMQMFVWTNPFAQLVTVNSPAQIADSYVANPSNSGGNGNGLTADLMIVDDGVAPERDACEPLLNDLTGKIAVIVWNEGACNSSVFVLNASNAGAVGAIIVDNNDEPITNFGGSFAIPSVAVGQPVGELIIVTLEGGDVVNATLEDNPDGQIDRDSDNDNGIIVHEYGHGISNRLTGGPNNTSCLFNSEQMGEGWSDWLGLVMTAVDTDTGPMPRGIGNYAIFAGADGPGIRTFPYSNDLAVNPLTYADIVTQSVPHGVGEVWVTMIWDMYWALTDRYGWDEVFTNPDAGPGLALQLVMDGMKLQPCLPTFQSGRDAILDADMVNNGGANECLIWEAFARRGMGLSADAGGTGNTDGTEAFDLPAQCSGGVGLDLSLSGTCPGSMTVTINGASPGATVAVGLGTGSDGITLPSGPCAGTMIDLSGVITRQEFVADASGTVSFDQTPGAGVCGGFVQAVDFSTCEASDLLQVP